MNPSGLGTVIMETETVFGENVSTFAVSRLPIITKLDVSGLKQPRSDSNRIQQYKQGGSNWLLMAQECSFKLKFWLTGHGSTTSGAVTPGIVESLMGYALGNIDATPASGTTCGAGSTATVVVTVASGTFPPGALVRVGTLGDGRGNGQWAIVSTHITTNLTLLTALPGIPNAGDVVYSASLAYTTESPAPSAPQSMRMLLALANQRYETHGVVITGVTIDGLNPGELPSVEFECTGAWWQYNTAVTFPSTVATEVFNASPTAAGSLFLQAVGTATRATRVYRTFKLAIKLGIVMEKGPGGVNGNQVIVGARRIPDDYKITWTEDAEPSGTHTLDDAFIAGTAQQMLLGLSCTPGSAMCLRFGNLNWCSDRPVQVDTDNLGRMKAMMEANATPVTTSDRTQAAFMVGFA